MGMKVKQTTVNGTEVQTQRDTDMGEGEYHSYAFDGSEWVHVASAKTAGQAQRKAVVVVKSWKA